MKRCVECGGKLGSVQTEEVFTVGEHKISMELPARRCTVCGELYVAGDDAERAELMVAAQLLSMGIDTGAAFRFMRKSLGLRAADLADLLNLDAATVSRWENEKVAVDRAALATLAAATSERLSGQGDATLDRLRTLREGKRAAREIRAIHEPRRGG